MDKVIVEPPSHWKEARRFRAWELVQQGWKQKDVAEAPGVTSWASPREQ